MIWSEVDGHGPIVIMKLQIFRKLKFSNIHRVPVNEPTIAGVGDDAAKSLVVAEGILNQGAGDELVEQLPQRQFQTLVEILGNDCVRLIDDPTRRRLRPIIDKGFTRHRRSAHPSHASNSSNVCRIDRTIAVVIPKAARAFLGTERPSAVTYVLPTDKLF